MDRQNRLQSFLQFQDLTEHPPIDHSSAPALFPALPAVATVAPAGDVDLYQTQCSPTPARTSLLSWRPAALRAAACQKPNCGWNGDNAVLLLHMLRLGAPRAANLEIEFPPDSGFLMFKTHDLWQTNLKLN